MCEENVGDVVNDSRERIRRYSSYGKKRASFFFFSNYTFYFETILFSCNCKK